VLSVKQEMNVLLVFIQRTVPTVLISYVKPVRTMTHVKNALRTLSLLITFVLVLPNPIHLKSVHVKHVPMLALYAMDQE